MKGKHQSAATRPANSGAKSAAEPSLHCPNCSSRLEPLKCKLLCRRCGYFMSCADYY